MLLIYPSIDALASESTSSGPTGLKPGSTGVALSTPQEARQCPRAGGRHPGRRVAPANAHTPVPSPTWAPCALPAPHTTARPLQEGWELTPRPPAPVSITTNHPQGLASAAAPRTQTACWAQPHPCHPASNCHHVHPGGTRSLSSSTQEGQAPAMHPPRKAEVTAIPG